MLSVHFVNAKFKSSYTGTQRVCTLDHNLKSQYGPLSVQPSNHEKNLHDILFYSPPATCTCIPQQIRFALTVSNPR